MNRRSKGEGNIRERSDGRFEARLCLDGKSKSIMGRTRKEVTEKLNILKHDIQRGVPMQTDERQTLGEYLDSWLIIKKPTVEFSYWKRCEEVIRLYVKPTLGKTPLTKLTAQQIQQLYAHLLEQGKAPRTIEKVHIALRKALQDALRHDLVVRNVATLVDKPKAQPIEMEIYSPDQVQRFIEAARGHRLAALFILMPTTGCRLGELLGLRWEAIDLERGELRISSAMKDVGGHQWLGTPKTPRSRRTVPLTSMAVEALRQHHVDQTVERLLEGSGWNPQHLVFCTSNGTPLTQTNFRKQYYKPLIDKAGLPYIRPHDQRHTNASTQLNSGEQVHVVSAWLGHASPSTTLNIYAHLMSGAKEGARDRLERTLGTNAEK